MGSKKVLKNQQENGEIDILFSSDPNFFYITKRSIDGCFLVKEKGKIKVFAVKMNYELAKKLFKNVRLWKKDTIKKLVYKKVVGLNYQTINAKLIKRVERYAKETIDISDELLKRRAMKKSQEVSLIRRGVKETLDIIHSIEIKEGMCEKDIEKQLLVETYERGLKPAFEPIVSTYGTSKFPHYKPSNKRIKDHVLIDYGVKIKGYASDVTEMIFLKKSSIENIYNKVKEAFYEIIDKIDWNMRGKDVDRIYKEVFKRLKLKRMPHLIGHGVGLEVHEKPFLTPNSDDKIRNAVLAIEPAQYMSKYGVRFEREIFIGKKVKVL